MSVAKCVYAGVAAIGLLAAIGPAYAADPYYYGGYKDQPTVAVPQLSLWQGFYGGAHAGGLWSSVDAAGNVVFLTEGAAVQASQSVDVSSYLLGGQVGYNFQTGNFVYGVEADLGWMDNKGSGIFRLNPLTNTVSVSSQGGWYGDIALRGGYAYNDMLFYAKGGFAFLTAGVNVSVPAAKINQDSGTFTGWTIGAGAEYMISPRWSLKAEYLYYDFGNNTCCFSSTAGRFDDDVSMHTLKVGFNFFLHSSLSPLN